MFEELRKELRQMMNQLADDIATGDGIVDFAQYQRLVGKMEGYAEAERLILDVLDKIDRIDE